MEPQLASAIKQAKRAGGRPFERFLLAKGWVDRERLRRRGIVDELQERVVKEAGEREKAAAEQLARGRERRGGETKGAKGPKAEDEAVGCARDLGYAKGVHSHLLELRRAAIDKVRERKSERKSA